MNTCAIKAWQTLVRKHTSYLSAIFTILLCLSTGFFKGTSADQDRRFSDKELKLLKSMKFPPEFEKKVIVRDVPLTCLLFFDNAVDFL